MMHRLVILVCVASYVYAQEPQNGSFPSDVGLNEKQLITKYGYPVESHTVQTEDGYILKMFRIPYGKNNADTPRRIPVLLLPGLLASSSCWVVMGPEKGLGYILADKGYDVWLGNYRGTRWGRKHIKLSPSKNKKEFWNFGIQEMAYYDLPALIDYVLNVTHQDKLFYLGHSQGGTTFIAMLTLRPVYNKKVLLMFGLSPVVYLGNADHIIIRTISSHEDEIQAISDSYNIYELLPHSPLITAAGGMFCHDKSPFQDICVAVFYFAAGFSSRFNQSIIPVVSSSMPAGTSVKVIRHFAQMHNSKQFQNFDYGDTENMKRYGQSSPPLYNFSQITVPMAIYYSDSDLFHSLQDVTRTISSLPNVVRKKLLPGYSHLDFTWATDAVPLLFNDIVELMKQYEPL